MTQLQPGETINLRCEHCGHMRTPILDRADEGVIMVICHECMRRSLDTMDLSFVPEKTIPRAWTVDPTWTVPPGWRYLP
jgi:hypothetical protein